MSNVVKIRSAAPPARVRRSLAPVHDLPQITGALPRPAGPAKSEEPVVVRPDLRPAAPHVLPDGAGEYERGFADGLAQAEARIRREYAERAATHAGRIDALLSSMQGQLWHLYERIERDAFRFAIAVAGKIIKREVAADDGTSVRQVQEALRRVVGVDAVRLRVHPSDEQVIRDHRPEILSGAEAVREFLVEADETVEAGSCIVECASGNVDARWTTQLRQVENALFGRISGIVGEGE